MIKSQAKDFGGITFPTFKGDRLYMHPIEIGNEHLPEQFNRWTFTVLQMLKKLPHIKTGTAYVTIDEKELSKGQTHRRGGAHTDGNYLYSWGGGGGWMTGSDGRYLTAEQHFKQYCSETGGMIIASNYESSQGWNGFFFGMPNQGGDCEHMRRQLKNGFNLRANTVYVANSTFVHESLPVQEDVKRSLIRITLPHNAKVL